MTEREWVDSFAPLIHRRLHRLDSRLSVVSAFRLPYACEMVSYHGSSNIERNVKAYETDLLVKEQIDNERWIPRVIVEAKWRGSITTHDAITYSHKAFTHRQVHPYVRYGILIGGLRQARLPTRLFWHGTEFDFMLAWSGKKAHRSEMRTLVDLLTKEVNASRNMEDLILRGRKTHVHFSLMHKQLILS